MSSTEDYPYLAADTSSFCQVTASTSGMLAVIDAANGASGRAVTNYSYDAQGRTIEEDDPVGASGLAADTLTQYNYLGQVYQTTTPSGATSTTLYDALGRVYQTTATAAAGTTVATTYQYDSTAPVDSPEGTQTVTITTSTVQGSSQQGQTVDYYNALGQLIEEDVQPYSGSGRKGAIHQI